jgi:acyl carrier protein
MGEVDRARDMVVPLDGFIDVEVVRTALKRVLPGHMVPSSYVGLRRLPWTASGKLDRKALPDVEGSVARARYAAPSNQAEMQVAAALAELLGVERVGIDDNFFDLGGHSLLAVQFVSRLRERLGVEVPLQALFEAPTVAGLAARLGEARASLPLIVGPRPAVLPLSYRQEHMWRNQQLKNDAYWNCPFAVRLNGSVDANLLFAAINAVVERHEVLRTRYPPRRGSRSRRSGRQARLSCGARTFRASSPPSARRHSTTSWPRSPFGASTSAAKSRCASC